MECSRLAVRIAVRPDGGLGKRQAAAHILTAGSRGIWGSGGPLSALPFLPARRGPEKHPPSFLPGQVGTGEGAYAPVTIQTPGTMWEPPSSPPPQFWEAGAGQGWEESWVGFGAGRPGLSNIIALLLRSFESGASPSTPGPQALSL